MLCHAAYMWAGSFTDAVQHSAAAWGLQFPTSTIDAHRSGSYVAPTRAEIHAAFEQARQHTPDFIDTRFALNRPPRHLSLQHEVATLPLEAHDSSRSSQPAATPETAAHPLGSISTSQPLHTEDADLPSVETVNLQLIRQPSFAAEPYPTPDNEYRKEAVSTAINAHMPLTGSGASFAMPEDRPLWVAKAQHAWTAAMAYLHAAQQPISFFNDQLSANAEPLCASDACSELAEQAQESGEPLYGFAYSPWPQPSVMRDIQQHALSCVKQQMAAAAALLSAAQSVVSEHVRQQATSAGHVLHQAMRWGQQLLRQPLQAVQKPASRDAQVCLLFMLQ